MPHNAAKFTISLTAENIPKKAEIAIKEWTEYYKPERQRTVQSETTKDKAGALSPAVYEKAKSGTWIRVSFPDTCVKISTISVSNESELRSISSDCTAVTFVSDENIPQDLIGNDSDSNYDETESKEIVEHRNSITGSGRKIKASMRFDL